MCRLPFAAPFQDAKQSLTPFGSRAPGRELREEQRTDRARYLAPHRLRLLRGAGVEASRRGRWQYRPRLQLVGLGGQRTQKGHIGLSCFDVPTAV
eukprot:9302981-Alexandrium_andersonii.AAC.1